MKPGVFVIFFILNASQLTEEVKLVDLLDKAYKAVVDDLVKLVAKCTTDKKASNVRYWLYTQNKSEQLIENITAVDPTKRVIIILHGYLGNKDVNYTVSIKNAYIKRYNNVNVIIPDYGFYVDSNYPSSRCNLPFVAKNIARFICQLKINTSDIHIVGQCLGGQLAGLVGLHVQNVCGKIGRITALDPAGPLYQDVHKNDRLDETDATFVDVIHTNRGQLGYEGSLGHVHFYPNNGRTQPNCDYILYSIHISNVTKVAREYMACNHETSAYYFAESINLNSFYAISSYYCPFICIEDEFDADMVYMGEYLKSLPEKQAYRVETNENSPYGQGPNGPLE